MTHQPMNEVTVRPDLARVNSSLRVELGEPVFCEIWTAPL